jgi:hypothetical protein
MPLTCPIQWEITANAITTTTSQKKDDNIQPTKRARIGKACPRNIITMISMAQVPDLILLTAAADIPANLATVRTAFPATNLFPAFSTFVAGIWRTLCRSRSSAHHLSTHSTPARRVQLREFHL